MHDVFGVMERGSFAGLATFTGGDVLNALDSYTLWARLTWSVWQEAKVSENIEAQEVGGVSEVGIMDSLFLAGRGCPFFLPLFPLVFCLDFTTWVDLGVAFLFAGTS